MDEEKENIRKTITSILLSTPLTLTINQLAKDYIEMVGTKIPFQKFGCKTLEQFLHSLPFEIFGQGCYAEIRARPTANAAHINKLVVQQRVSIPKHKKGFARLPINRRPQLGLLPTPAYPPLIQQNVFKMKPIQPPTSFQNQKGPTQTPQVKDNIFSNPTNQSNNVSEALQQMAEKVGNDSKNNHNNLTKPEKNESTYKPLPPWAVDSKLSNSSGWGADRTKGINFPPYLEPSSKPKQQLKHKKKRVAVAPRSSRNEEFVSSSENSFNVENYFSSLPENIKKTAEIATATGSRTSPRNVQQTDFEDIFFSDSEDENYMNYNVPIQVQQNLQVLIKMYPEGIWCSELPSIYKATFKTELDHTMYNYKTLMALCIDLDKIFHCIRPDKGDIKLYDKSKPLPLDAESSLQFVDYLKNNEAEMEYFQGADALPDVSEVLMYRKQSEYPPDVVHLLEDLPRQWIPEDTELMTFIDITVGEIYDPSKFWIVLSGANTSNKLDEMMDEMQEFYSGNRELEIPEDKLEVGLYCAAVILGEYHRAIIVHLMPKVSGQVKVFFIDYGTVSPLYGKGICYLHRKFFQLPQQAIRARLANIYPPTEKMQWSRQSATDFLEMVFQKTLAAQIFKIDEKRKALELIIADTSGKDDIYINDKLVEMGHAIFTYQDQIPIELPPEEEPNVRFIHLFPTFDELEQGLVPTATQTNRLQDSGVEVHNIYPNYFGPPDERHIGTRRNDAQTNSVTNISRYMKKTADCVDDYLELDDFSIKKKPLLSYVDVNVGPLIDLTSDLENESSPCLEPSRYDPGAILNGVGVFDFKMPETERNPCLRPSTYDLGAVLDDIGVYDLKMPETKDFQPHEITKRIVSDSCSISIPDFPEVLKSSTNEFLSHKTTEKNASGSFSKSVSEKVTKPSAKSEKIDDPPQSVFCFDPADAISEPEVSLPLVKAKNDTPIHEENKIQVARNVRPPPGFERFLNVTSTNTQNVIPSIQQNFFNLYIGNPHSPSYTPLYPMNFLGGMPVGAYSNIFQQQQLHQQQQLLYEELARNNALIGNFRQQQMQIHTEQNVQNTESGLSNIKRKRMVIEVEIYSKSFHLIRYNDEVYCYIQEIQRLFFDSTLPIIKLKRQVAFSSPEIKIENLHRSKCTELANEILRIGMTTEAELSSTMCLLHLIAFKDLPQLVNTLSQTKIEFYNFDKYLSIYDYNSDTWNVE